MADLLVARQFRRAVYAMRRRFVKFAEREDSFPENSAACVD